MKNSVLVILGLIFIFIFGMQALMFYKLNKKVDRQLASEEKSALSSQEGSNTWVQKPDHWNPYQELLQIRNQMEQMFDDTFSRFKADNATGAYIKMPTIDLQDEPHNYVITVKLPGAIESSFNAKLDGQKLNISVKTENKNENSKYQRQEVFKGEFQGSVLLPGNVNQASMKTDYKDGVFKITLAKAG